MWEGGNTTQRGYGHAWRKIREQALQRDSYQCQHCLRQGRYIQATDVDHIKEKSKGGTDDLGNLQSLCKRCHADKTAGKRLRPCTPMGHPTDPAHHWNGGKGG